MKKFIFFVAVFLTCGTIALQGKMTTLLIKEKVVTKTAVFSIFQASNYSSKLYKKSNAKIVLTVYKITGNLQKTLWETIIDRGNLRNYPLIIKPLYRKLSFYNIYEQTEDIVASYKVIYNTRGSEFSYEQNCLLKNATGDTLLIGI